MATKADVQERVAEPFREEKDREMLTEASNVVVEKSEGIAEPLPKFEVQVTKGAIEVNGKNTEGEFIYESPLVAKVADEQILSPSELNGDAVVLNETETKFLESSVGKETEKNRDEIVSTINENSTKEIQHISKETSSGSSQIAEGKFFEPDLAEEMKVLEPASSKEDVGEVTISEEGLGHTILKESENVNTDPEEMKSRGDMKDEDSNNETILSDATGNANLKSENASDQKEEATEICENGNRNLDISSTVTPVEEKCIADAGSDNTFSEAIGSSDALENEHIVEAEASTGKPLSSSAVEPKYVTHHTEAKPDTEVSLASTEASDRSKVADEVQTEVEEPGKLKDDENFPDSETIQINLEEEPLYATPDKIDVSESCQSTETTTTVVNLPEALKEATNDKTLDAHYTPEKQTEDISTDDLKKEDDDIPSNTIPDLRSTHPLVDETKQEQVFEENQVHITEPTDVHDAHEANSIPECSTIVQTLAEGESGLQKDEPSTPKLRFESLNEVQDESAIAAKDKECEAEETSEVQEIPSSDSQSIENDKSVETGAEMTFTYDRSLSLQTSNKDVDNVSKEYSEASHVESEKVEKILEPATEVHYEIEESGTKGESIEAAVPESGVEKIPNKETNEANGTTENYISSDKNISTVDLNEDEDGDISCNTANDLHSTPPLVEETKHEQACSHKEESNTPELRFTSFEEIQDESGIEAKEKESEAEETSKVQLERSVPEIQVSECQSVGNDESVENGAEKSFTDEQSLISESSKKYVEDLAISNSTENEVLPEEAGKEHTEASHAESEHLEKILDRATPVLYSDYEAEGNGIKEESLEAPTTEIGAEKILNEDTNEAKGITESYISSEKNITTVDLNDEEDVDTPCYTPKDIQHTVPLVEETKQEQVREENEVPIEELKHVHEAISIPESSTIEKTLAEGDSDMDLTSTRQVDADNLEEEFKLNSTEKLQIDAENNTEDQLQQHGEAREENGHETPDAVENTTHESETISDAPSVTISEEAGLEEASLKKEESSKSFEEIEDGSGTEVKAREDEAEVTSEVQPPQDVHETQFSDSQSVENDKSVETEVEKTLTDDKCLSAESSKKNDDELTIPYPTEKEILPEEVGKKSDEAPHVESVAQVHYSEVPSELKESEMKEESPEAATTEKAITEELPSITTHVISDTAKSDDQCEVSSDKESEASKNIHKQITDEDGLVKGLHEGSTADSMLNRSLGEEETEREYTDEAPKELIPERDFDGLDRGDTKTDVKCSDEEVLSSEVVSLHPDKDIEVNDQEYSVEEKSQAHNTNISDSSVVDIPGPEGLENAVSEADHEPLLHKSTNESEISEISNQEVAITADDKPVEKACEEKEATEKSLPSVKADDKELEADETKDEEEEREVQKGEYSVSEVTPMVERDLVDITSDKIITEVEIKEDNSNVVQGDRKESTETAISSEDKHIQFDSVTGTVGLEIDEPIPVDSSEAARSNINEEAKECIEDQTTDSFELARSNKNEEAIEKNEDQATEIFEAARNDNNEEVTEHNEDQAKVVATRDSETNRDESDPSSITEGEEPKIHDRDVKLENLSPPDQSNTDVCQIDEHLDLATPTEIAPDSIELQNASLATKEIRIVEEPQTIESTEVTTISAGKDVELLQKDLEATVIHDEVQKPKTENETDAAPEIATVESEAKDASDEIKEMEEESSIKQATYSEPDLTQGSVNTTPSVAEERETLDQLLEDHVSEHVHLVQKDSSERMEPVISSEEKDTLLVEPVPVTGAVTREIEEITHANASETEAKAEAEYVECGEEQKTIHDYNLIPESSQSTDSTESAPSNLLHGSADVTTQKVDDIVSETLPSSHLLPSHDQKEPEADPKVTTEIVQAGGEISKCVEQSFEETKSEEEERTKDEMNEATVKSLPAEETNTAAPEEETLEIIEHPSERSEQIVKNDELQTENAESDEDKKLKSDEAKDEEEEGKVQREEKSCSEVPLVAERDLIDVTSDKIIAEVETKEDSSSAVLDGKISEQFDTEESIETVISSEDKHIQSDFGTGTVGLEIDESKHADSSEAAGSNKSEQAKENYEDQTSDSFELAQSIKNEEAVEKIEDQATEIFEAAQNDNNERVTEHNEDQAKEIFEAARNDNNEEVTEHNEDQATFVATSDSETKRDESDSPSSITEEDPKIHDRDVKLENLSPPDQSNTDICQIDERLDLATPTEVANVSLAIKEKGILEEPRTIESIEVTTISAGKEVELLQKDSEATIIHDEVQKLKTENDHDAASEIAPVESEAKDASDEFKEMEEESYIKHATDSEPDLTQGSINTTLSVADERETLDQLPEDHVPEHVPLVEKDSSERIEPMISSEEKDTLLEQAVPVIETVPREIEGIMHANASETEAESIECGEEQKTIHDYNQIPESSQSTDSTESAPSDLLQRSADETIQKVDDIVSETPPPAHLLSSHDQKEPEADPKVTINPENSMNDKGVPSLEEEATTEIVQAGGEISRCAEESFVETKSEEEQRTKDETNEATVKSLPTAALEEETREIIEHPSERSEQIAKNEELQTENIESDEDRKLKSDEAKDEEEEGKVQREEKSCSEVPLVAERDLIDGTSNKIISEVETKEDCPTIVLDGKISEQVDTEESIETVLSSEDKHIQSDSGAGNVGLEIDESKHADSSEAAGSNKSEEAKENYEGQAIDSSDAAEINENEGPKENNEDQVTVEAQGSETKQNEDDTQSNITEGDDLKIHVPDVKVENLSPSEQSSTTICEIDEPLVLAKPTEIAPDTTELDKISLSPKENENPEEPPSSECADVTIASRDIDVKLLQNDEIQKLETANVSDAALKAATVEPEPTGTTDESTFIETTKNSESDVVQGSENLTLSVGEEKETAQPVEDNVYLGVQDLKTGTIPKEEQVNLSRDESIREEVNDSRSFEVPANKIQAQKDPEESSEPVLCSGDEDISRTEEAKGEEVPKVADEINEPATKIVDNSAKFEEEILVVPENAERFEAKDVKTGEEEREVQRGENSGFEDSVDLTNIKIITSEVKQDNSIVVPETIPAQGESEENTETLISKEVPFMVTRAVNLENEELKHVNDSDPAAETKSLECEEDTKATRDYTKLPESSKSMEPSENSPYENLQASAKVTPVEAEAFESQDPESLHVPPQNKSSSIENSTKDGASDINITPDKQEPEASPLLASSEHIVLEADQKATPEPENSECVVKVQQEATSESYQEDPEPAKIKEETKEATVKSLPTETTSSITTLSEKADHFNEEIKVVPEKEELQVKIAETDEKEEGENSGSDAPVIVEASRDIETKVSPKKSNNILSGVGSKVKHSIAKVKKAITGSGKHSHSKESKPTSPK